MRTVAEHLDEATPVQAEAVPAANVPTDQELLAQAFACLVALVELAHSAGQSARVDQLRAAIEVLRPGIHRAGGGSQPLGATASNPTLLWTPTSYRTGCPLTSRQHEVAQLIGHGLTNLQIADRLIISERTADTHVQSILGRLGFVRRAQIAGWYVKHTFGISAGAIDGDLPAGVPRCGNRPSAKLSEMAEPD